MPAKDAKCNCDMPWIAQISNVSYLGRDTRYRLCCLTTFIEQLYEVSLHETRDTEPIASWNEELAGQPIPQFIADRIEQKRAMGFKMDAPPSTGEYTKKRPGDDLTEYDIYLENAHKYLLNVEPNDDGKKPLFKRVANRARESWLRKYIVPDKEMIASIIRKGTCSNGTEQE